MEQNTNTTLFGLSIDPIGKAHLTEAAKWARFLAIVGFVFITIFALALIFGGAYLSTLFTRQGGGFDGAEIDSTTAASLTIAMILYYLVIFVLVFLGYLFLYRFSTNMKRALVSNDQDTLNRSFMYLKVLYRYYGILTIIGLVLGCLGLIFVIASGAMMQ